MLERRIEKPIGPDPGVVYVQRSPALEPDLFKVGLTRRNPEVRAAELSFATGVPLPLRREPTPALRLRAAASRWLRFSDLVITVIGEKGRARAGRRVVKSEKSE